MCPANDLEYDYPQWHWLGRENSFKIPIQSGRHSNVARSEQGCQINLSDILPPPPYEVYLLLLVMFHSRYFILIILISYRVLMVRSEEFRCV